MTAAVTCPRWTASPSTRTGTDARCSPMRKRPGALTGHISTSTPTPFPMSVDSCPATWAWCPSSASWQPRTCYPPTVRITRIADGVRAVTIGGEGMPWVVNPLTLDGQRVAAFLAGGDR